MKRLSFIFAFVLISLSWCSFAQNVKPATTPMVVLGTIEPNGKNSGQTTKAEILANPRLIVKGPNCYVTGYTFSMLPDGHDFVGPFTITGSELTPKIQNLIKENTGKILIENITMKYSKYEMTASSIALKYNH